MPASSNFNQAIREAQTSSIVGPNVVQKALPYVGGGMVLTSLGVLAGISLIATNPSLFQPLSSFPTYIKGVLPCAIIEAQILTSFLEGGSSF